MDWKEFTTVDCIGDVDGELDDEDETNGDSANADDSAPASAAASNGEHIFIGSEFVKEIQVKWCDLCQCYLPREDTESGLRRHCAKRSHLNNYLEHKEIERIRLAAVRIHQQEEKKKLSDKRKREEKLNKEAAMEVDEKSATAAGGQEEDDDAVDSKIWADVDKDLGELLQAVSSENAHDDEDEEDSTTTTER